jgi:2-dehydropantoate 2-reductase
MRWKHRKLLMNLGNAVDALCGPDARRGELAKRATAEGEAVLAAAGIAAATREEDRDRRADLLSLRPVEGRRRVGSSSSQSLARGTGTIESDFLNGEIVLLGRLHGVPTPVNEVLQRLAREAAAEGRAPGSTAEAAVLALVSEGRRVG